MCSRSSDNRRYILSSAINTRRVFSFATFGNFGILAISRTGTVKRYVELTIEACWICLDTAAIRSASLLSFRFALDEALSAAIAALSILSASTSSNLSVTITRKLIKIQVVQN